MIKIGTMKKLKYLILVVSVLNAQACIGQDKQTSHTKHLLLNDQLIEQV